jgi:hypothetical protein
MKKIFIVSMEAYDDFGAYLGTTIVGAYTTLEIAQRKVDKLKEPETTFIDYQYGIEESVLEEE